MISLQAAQRFVSMHWPVPISTMYIPSSSGPHVPDSLGRLPSSLQFCRDDVPNNVEERNAAIHGPPPRPTAVRRQVRLPVMPTKPQRRYSDVVATELSHGNRVPFAFVQPPAIIKFIYSRGLAAPHLLRVAAEKRPAASHP